MYAEFCEKLNLRYQLGLTSDVLHRSAKVLNDQWFTFASELEHADVQDFKYLDIPNSLSGAIFAVFHPDQINPYPVSLPSSTPTLPSNPPLLSPSISESKGSEGKEEKEGKEKEPKEVKEKKKGEEKKIMMMKKQNLKKKLLKSIMILMSLQIFLSKEMKKNQRKGGVKEVKVKMEKKRMKKTIRIKLERFRHSQK